LNFSLITVFRILVELPKIIFGAIIMGNQGGHVKGNDPQRAKRLLDLAKEILRYKRYSIRTEEAYIGVYTFLMHWRENIQMRTGNGDGRVGVIT
jgi:hypothetical protein